MANSTKKALLNLLKQMVNEGTNEIDELETILTNYPLGLPSKEYAHNIYHDLIKAGWLSPGARRLVDNHLESL